MYCAENQETVQLALATDCVEKQGVVQVVTPLIECTVGSVTFQGTCVKGVSENKCISVCRTEGFTGGKCGGICQRCYCAINC